MFLSIGLSVHETTEPHLTQIIPSIKALLFFRRNEEVKETVSFTISVL